MAASDSHHLDSDKRASMQPRTEPQHPAANFEEQERPAAETRAKGSSNGVNDVTTLRLVSSGLMAFQICDPHKTSIRCVMRSRDL